MSEPTRAVLSGLNVAIFRPDAPRDVAYLIAPASEAEAVWNILAPPKPALVSVQAPDWNRDLSPWPAPKAFRGGQDFAGHADAFLRTLVNEVVPSAEASMGFAPSARGLAGVSLAGLFAVYAAYQTPCFQRIASVSGSLWYDGFIDFMKERPLAAAVRRAYFSLGDRESMTKNARLASVESCMRQAVGLWNELGVETKFEMNPGNHFADGAARMKKAIDWICGT